MNESPATSDLTPAAEPAYAITLQPLRWADPLPNAPLQKNASALPARAPHRGRTSSR